MLSSETACPRGIPTKPGGQHYRHHGLGNLALAKRKPIPKNDLRSSCNTPEKGIAVLESGAAPLFSPSMLVSSGIPVCQSFRDTEGFDGGSNVLSLANRRTHATSNHPYSTKHRAARARKWKGVVKRGSAVLDDTQANRMRLSVFGKVSH